MFAYKLRYVLDKAHELIDFTDYKDLFDKYETLKKSASITPLSRMSPKFR